MKPQIFLNINIKKLGKSPEGSIFLFFLQYCFFSPQKIMRIFKIENPYVSIIMWPWRLWKMDRNAHYIKKAQLTLESSCWIFSGDFNEFTRFHSEFKQFFLIFNIYTYWLLITNNIIKGSNYMSQNLWNFFSYYRYPMSKCLIVMSEISKTGDSGHIKSWCLIIWNIIE